MLSFRVQTTSKYRALTTGIPYLQQVRERVRSLPGVTAVGGIGHLPMSGYSWTIPVHRVDQPPAEGASAPEVGWRFIWGDYLEAMRIPVIAGRSFTDADSMNAPRVAMVNETLARRFFGSPAAALGQQLVQKGGGTPGDTIVEIVGVIGDVRHRALNEPPRPELFRPLLQTFMFPMHMVARTAGAPGDLAAAVRKAAFDVDPDGTRCRTAASSGAARRYAGQAAAAGAAPVALCGGGRAAMRRRALRRGRGTGTAA